MPRAARHANSLQQSMTRIIVSAIVLGALSLLANTALAQVHVFANAETAGTIRKVNRPNSWARAVLDVAKRPSGLWFQLVGSDIEGHGSIFCSSRQGGADPHYFVSEGRATASEATTEARQLAQRFAAGRDGYSVFWCGQFNNVNRYPLTGPSGSVLPLSELERAILTVDRQMSEEERELRLVQGLIQALELALSHTPIETPTYTAEQAAKGLLQFMDLDPAAQAEADALSRQREERISQEVGGRPHPARE